MPKQDSNWPAWRYGPDGAADIFDAPGQVPTGWVSRRAMVAAGEKLPIEPLAAGLAAPSTEEGDKQPAEDEIVDKLGWPWDPARNTANKAMTQSGLWQLLPGQSRPAAKPGFPKDAPALEHDL